MVTALRTCSCTIALSVSCQLLGQILAARLNRDLLLSYHVQYLVQKRNLISACEPKAEWIQLSPED